MTNQIKELEMRIETFNKNKELVKDLIENFEFKLENEDIYQSSFELKKYETFRKSYVIIIINNEYSFCRVNFFSSDVLFETHEKNDSSSFFNQNVSIVYLILLLFLFYQKITKNDKN